MFVYLWKRGSSAHCFGCWFGLACLFPTASAVGLVWHVCLPLEAWILGPLLQLLVWICHVCLPLKAWIIGPLLQLLQLLQMSGPVCANFLTESNNKKIR
jgi:hypothetical protein